jgi:hypothetical protein
MQLPADIESMLEVVAAMERTGLVELLRTMPCPFPLDFTDEYLAGIELDRLRHLVAAVCLQVRKGRAA